MKRQHSLSTNLIPRKYWQLLALRVSVAESRRRVTDLKTIPHSISTQLFLDLIVLLAVSMARVQRCVNIK